jgi:hypothetical protein
VKVLLLCDLLPAVTLKLPNDGSRTAAAVLLAALLTAASSRQHPAIRAALLCCCCCCQQATHRNVIRRLLATTCKTHGTGSFEASYICASRGVSAVHELIHCGSPPAAVSTLRAFRIEAACLNHVWPASRIVLPQVTTSNTARCWAAALRSCAAAHRGLLQAAPWHVGGRPQHLPLPLHSACGALRQAQQEQAQKILSSSSCCTTASLAASST